MPAKNTIDLSGIDFKGLEKAVRAAAGQGIKVAIDYLGEESDKVTPRDTGDLIRSRRNTVDRDALVGDIKYTDPIAAIMHENLYVKHKDGRTAKYLETTGAAHGRDALELVGREIKKVIGS